MSKYVVIILNNEREQMHLELSAGSIKKAQQKVYRAYPAATIKFISRLDADGQPVKALTEKAKETLGSKPRQYVGTVEEASKSLVPTGGGKPRIKAPPATQSRPVRPACRLVIKPEILEAIGGPAQPEKELSNA